MALAEVSRQDSPSPSTPFTSAGRHALGARALAHPIITVLVVYLVSRVVSLVALWVAATWFQNPAGVGHADPALGDMFGLWDGVWYERIVHDGYPVPLPVDADTGRVTYSAWAFYPLYPYLVKGVMLTGMPFAVAGGVLNLVLAGAAAVLIWAVLRSGVHADRQPQRERLALVAACLWCFYPTTAVMLKPYTEALAGQRASAVVMLAALAVSAVAWPVVAGLVTGVPTAFFDVQAAWGQRPDKGPFVLWFEWAWQSKGMAGVVVLVALVATYIALVLGRHGRWICIEARAWALAYPLYLFAVVRPITSMWRFLLLDFPLAALLASVAMRTANGQEVVPHWRRRVAVVLLVAVAGLFWWTCSLLVYTPWGSFPP
jgi:hypothetical protein